MSFSFAAFGVPRRRYLGAEAARDGAMKAGPVVRVCADRRKRALRIAPVPDACDVIGQNCITEDHGDRHRGGRCRGGSPCTDAEPQDAPPFLIRLLRASSGVGLQPKWRVRRVLQTSSPHQDTYANARQRVSISGPAIRRERGRTDRVSALA